jgi:hypothetical protein
MQETDYEVDMADIIDVVKELVGLSSTSDDVTPQAISNVEYDPADLNWQYNKVYDEDGKIQNESQRQVVDQSGLVAGFNQVAKEHKEITGKWTFADGKQEKEEPADEWTAQEVCAPPSPKGKWAYSYDEDHEDDSNEWGAEEFVPEQEPKTVVELKEGDNTKSSSKKDKSKREKKKKDSNEECTIFDLLSPPPVTLLIV